MRKGQLLEIAVRLLREKETLMRANEQLRADKAELERRIEVYNRYIAACAP